MGNLKQQTNIFRIKMNFKLIFFIAFFESIVITEKQMSIELGDYLLPDGMHGAFNHTNHLINKSLVYARAKRKEQKTHKIHDRKMTEERLQKISERIQKLAREPQSQEQIKQMNQKNRQGQMNQMNRKTKIESEYLDLEKYHSTMSNESKEKETNQKMKNNAENFVDSSLKSTQNNPKVDDSSIDDGLKNNQL